MSGFVLGALVVAAIWIMTSARPKENERNRERQNSGFSAVDEADSWFIKNKIISKSVVFSTYTDPELARNHGATILVGVGDNAEGGRVGFAMEVVPGRGVMESLILVPSGIATWHKDASMQAKIAKIPLIDVLNKMAIAHKERQIEASVPPTPASSKPAFPLNFDGPAITDAVPVRGYSSGEYTATLVHKIESIGAIKYLFILLVFRRGGESPILFVTSEENSMMPEMLKSLPQDIREAMGNIPSEPFIGVFGEFGRQSLGSSVKYADIDGFESAALAIARQKLGLSSPFQRSR